MKWYLEVLKKYAVFSGRAQRAEYWFFILFSNIIILAIVAGVIGFADTALGGIFVLLYVVYGLGVLLPSFGVMMRRLHDTSRSGWWWLIGFVPLVGGFILLYFLVVDSTPGDNQYGPNPKGE